MEFSIPLNKFEKEKKVIELHKQGGTIRDIAPVVHMSFRDISKIRKTYDKKVRLQQTKKEQENTQTPTKKQSLSIQAFVLYRQGKKIDEVKVLLDIPFRKAMIFWKQYLKSIKMYECYEFYEVFRYDLPTLLPISNFMKRNNVSGSNIVHILRTATEIQRLNEIYLNLKTELNF